MKGSWEPRNSRTTRNACATWFVSCQVREEVVKEPVSLGRRADCFACCGCAGAFCLCVRQYIYLPDSFKTRIGHFGIFLGGCWRGRATYWRLLQKQSGTGCGRKRSGQVPLHHGGSAQVGLARQRGCCRNRSGEGGELWSARDSSPLSFNTGPPARLTPSRRRRPVRQRPIHDVDRMVATSLPPQRGPKHISPGQRKGEFREACRRRGYRWRQSHSPNGAKQENRRTGKMRVTPPCHTLV